MVVKPTMVAEDPLMLVGQVLDGTYRIESVVGEGGFGVVYRALHLGFDEPVAVKCLKSSGEVRPEVREAFLAKFREESKILFQLSKGTVGITQAIAVGAVQSPSGVWAPYYVLEWLDGSPLSDVLDDRRNSGFTGMALDDAIRWLDGPAMALAYAHGRRVAHRDIKPANLFVLRGGGGSSTGAPVIKILDFGVAKTMEDSPDGKVRGLTAVGVTVFSPKYGAPEQFNRRLGDSGPWSDVYSFALVMIELLSDRRIYDTDSTMDIMQQALDPDTRPTPLKMGVLVPQTVEEVFVHALQVSPSQRYQNMHEFWNALRAAAQPGYLPASGAYSQSPSIPALPFAASAHTSPPPSSFGAQHQYSASQSSASIQQHSSASAPISQHDTGHPLSSGNNSGSQDQIQPTGRVRKSPMIWILPVVLVLAIIGVILIVLFGGMTCICSTCR